MRGVVPDRPGTERPDVGCVKVWCEFYAARFGITPRQALRDVEKVGKGGTFGYWQADRLASMVGEHPSAIWADWQGVTDRLADRDVERFGWDAA